MTRGYTIFRPRKHGKFLQLYPSLANVALILDGRPAFHRLANQYLIQRMLALWRPESGFAGFPTATTISNYASWLANFLEWAESRHVDLTTCEYVRDVIGGYQREMLCGDWSASGEGLKPATVNVRVQQACDYLTWLADLGHRPKFQISSNIRTVAYGYDERGMPKKQRVRSGKVRSLPPSLQMPSIGQTKVWLDEVLKKSGETLALVCETILLSGLRREEVICLRANSIGADPSEWMIVNPLAPESKQQVRVSVCFGAKGHTYGEDHGEKIGPEREILVPISLARRWHRYKLNARLRALKAGLADVPKGEVRTRRLRNSVHLFLHPETGDRFTGKQVYDAWTKAKRPTPNWSPHQGRHWWACSTLLAELKKHESMPSLSNETAYALLESTALSIIRLHIQPQLGHRSDTTTMTYLRWVTGLISVPVQLDVDDDTDKE
ncbi:site-specific integrase [Achromobacter spanius]|uniref:site-specific integrase n=1 Tax=Achromobacter spanius TaxID=217203 RepID=UPI001319F939|nr:site-specific integrase [Achromobacter spanius]